VGQKAIQAILVALLGLLIIAAVIHLSRTRKLSFRYTAGWIAIGGTGLLSSLLIPLAEPVADAFGLSATALVALVAAVLLLTVAVQLSISISGLQRQVQDIAEEIALINLESSRSTASREVNNASDHRSD